MSERETLPLSRQSMWLNDIGGVSSTDLWAVGWEARDIMRPLVVRRSGGGWERQPMPFVWDAKLNAVSARTAQDVWAVGFKLDDSAGLRPLAVHFDGAEWSLTRVPPRLVANLYDVVSTGPGEAWAVGTTGGVRARPILLRYSDGRWTPNHPQVLPARGYLAGLDRVGTGQHVIAVGGSGSSGNEVPLILAFDGRQWSRETLADNMKAGLRRVDGGLAVGTSTDVTDKEPVVLVRGRQSWRRLTVSRVDGHPTYLMDLTVTPAQGKIAAVAVGSIETRRGSRTTAVLRRHTGGTWAVLDSPNPGGDLNQLLGVWSVSIPGGGSDTWVVGTYYIGERAVPLIVGYLGCRPEDEALA